MHVSQQQSNFIPIFIVGECPLIFEATLKPHCFVQKLVFSKKNPHLFGCYESLASWIAFPFQIKSQLNRINRPESDQAFCYLLIGPKIDVEGQTNCFASAVAQAASKIQDKKFVSFKDTKVSWKDSHKLFQVWSFYLFLIERLCNWSMYCTEFVYLMDSTLGKMLKSFLSKNRDKLN